MSEPMKQNPQSVSQLPSNETKSCETCRHLHEEFVPYGSGGNTIHICNLDDDADWGKRCRYGQKGCAYEPIDDNKQGEGDGEK